MRQEYCQGCKQSINTMPFLGEPHKKFEDGVYCIQCSKVKVDKMRKNL